MSLAMCGVIRSHIFHHLHAMDMPTFLSEKYNITISDESIASTVQVMKTAVLYSTENQTKSENDIRLSDLNKEVNIVAIILREYCVTETSRPVRICLQTKDNPNATPKDVNTELPVVSPGTGTGASHSIKKKCTDVLMPTVALNAERIWFQMEDAQMSILKKLFPEFAAEDYKRGIMPLGGKRPMWLLPFDEKDVLKAQYGNGHGPTDRAVAPAGYEKLANEDSYSGPVCPLGYVFHCLAQNHDNPFSPYNKTSTRAPTDNGEVPCYKIPEEDGKHIIKVITQMMQDQRLRTNLTKLNIHMTCGTPFTFYGLFDIYYCDV